VPKSDTSDPRLRLEGRVRATREKLSVSEWVAVEDAKERKCQCGCGKRIRVRKHHHRKGVPKYLQGHHPMATTREVNQLREQGLLTSGAVARTLSIPLDTLRGLEGRLFERVPRHGKRRLRVFTREQVERLRAVLAEAGKARPQDARSRMNASGPR
jgi:DNA-binding transcriptional regulator YiaG